jgi:predicted MPP superfamily phosphohydrolase
MRRRDFLKLAAGAVATSFGGVAYAMQSNVIQITRNDLIIHNLPDPLRIVAISDLHAPSYFRNNDWESLVDMVNDQNADIFILGGDVVDQAGEERLVSLFSVIRAKLSKLAVLGNWEYDAPLDLKRLRIEYEKAGITLLVNERVTLGGLDVIGLDDFLRGYPNYDLLKGEVSSRPLLVTSHCPESFDFMPLSPKAAVIVISGHTHGGQIAPFGVALHTPAGCGTYLKGWYYKHKHCMYVTTGVGTVGIPVRMGPRPEILVLNLRGTESVT